MFKARTIKPSQLWKRMERMESPCSESSSASSSASKPLTCSHSRSASAPRFGNKYGMED